MIDNDAARAAIERLLAVTGGSFEQRARLEGALRSRIVIEQAKGILAERLHLTIDEAFALLRASARSHQMKLRALAAAVVEQKETPKEILATLGGALERSQVARRGGAA